MTVRTQTDSIIADTDAAIVIVVLPSPGKDQTNDRQKRKDKPNESRENSMHASIEYYR